MNDDEILEKAKKIIQGQKKKIKAIKSKIRKEKYRVFKDKVKESKIFKFFKKISPFTHEEKELYHFSEVVIVMLFSLGLGFITCFSFVKIFNGGKDYMALSNDLEKLVDTYYAITNNYYGNLDKDALIDDAIKGMVSSVGDVYTNYSDSDSTLTFNETVGGIYEGIGATVGSTTDGKIAIIDLFEDGPAAKAGLQVGDIITKIDGENYQSKTSTDVADYIKNSKKNKIVLTVMRGEEEKEVTIKMGKIEIPTITSNIFDKNDKKIGYIAIDIFSSVTNKQFSEALTELEKEKIDGLVIDVRDNGGGYLNVVTDIASLFLEKGKVIYKLEDSKGITEKKDQTKTKRTYPIAVITNAASASASEILASAIKESYNGFVVGTNTYGKGTVQQTTKLPDGSMVKYTVQNWLTPNGSWVQDTGLEPTDVVELNESYYENPSYDNDKND